ncbi:MAG: hypothetical protein Q8P18_00385 [Pseudomonadota bacterium]|nr:hypothetical protein [Pseudomonadota bacterium]
MRLALALVGAALAGCTPEPGTAQGRLVDARSGAAVPNVDLRFVARADKCPAITTTTDTDGRFSVTNLCGEGAWTVTSADPAWYLPDPVAAGPDVALRAWRAPEAAGVYTIAGDVPTPLVTQTVLDVVKVFDTDREVRFPVEIPGEVPRIDADVALLVVGGVLGDKLPFEALVPSPERRWFGTTAAPQPIDPWVYLGVRFESDAVIERVDAPLDAAAIERVGGPRPLQYVRGAALAPGRYALPTADGTRAFILDFGPASAAPAVAP